MSIDRMIAYHIMLVIVSVSGMYSLADSMTDMESAKEDKYLPRKKGKLGRLYRFSEKRPIRFSAYWLQKMGQIFLFIYIISLVIGRLVTQSFDFTVNSIFKYYPFLVFAFPAFFRMGIWLYIKVREHNDKTKSL